MSVAAGQGVARPTAKLLAPRDTVSVHHNTHRGMYSLIVKLVITPLASHIHTPTRTHTRTHTRVADLPDM